MLGLGSSLTGGYVGGWLPSDESSLEAWYRFGEGITLNGSDFTFNGSIDGGSNYNVTKTSGGGRAAHRESDADAFLQYADGLLAESTDYERITEANGSDNDQSVSGYLHLFEPSSTTFIKLYTIQANNAVYVDMSDQRFTGGYFNTTSAIDAMDFKMSADEIQGGSISMYGIT